MRIFLPLLSLFLALLLSGEAFAAPAQDLYSGTRELGMGGASTAVTEGDEAIFLNPAAMAGNQGAQFYLVNEQIQVSADAISEYEQTKDALSSISINTLQQLVGKDIYARSQFSPSLTLPNFGIAFLVDDQFELRTQNLSMPDVTLGLQETNGVQFATGFDVMGGGKHSVDTLRVGAGFKMMWRRGGYNDLSMDQILNLSENTVEDLAGNYGLGESGDFGVQYIHQATQQIQLLAGLDYQNIGGMSFSGGGEEQPEDLSIGGGLKYKGRDDSVTLDYDLKNLTNGYPISVMNHVGIAVQIPTIELDAGLNETRYLTAGATVDLWLIKASALTYEEELGEYAGQEGERVYALQLTFKLGI